jgi:YggT family protein
MQTLAYLLDTLLFFVIGACLLRAWLIAVGLSLVQQPGRFVVALTDWLVQPLRKILPRGMSLGGWDGGSLLAALLLAIAYGGFWAAVAMSGPSNYANSGVFFLLVPTLAFKMLLRTVFQGLFFLVLGYAILSWIQPQSHAYSVLDRLLTPLMAPFRRVIPVIGGVDLTPIAFLLVLQVLQSWIA